MNSVKPLNKPYLGLVGPLLTKAQAQQALLDRSQVQEGKEDYLYYGCH